MVEIFNRQSEQESLEHVRAGITDVLKIDMRRISQLADEADQALRRKDTYQFLKVIDRIFDQIVQANRKTGELMRVEYEFKRLNGINWRESYE